jgi:hypothetical protein
MGMLCSPPRAGPRSVPDVLLSRSQNVIRTRNEVLHVFMEVGVPHQKSQVQMASVEMVNTFTWLFLELNVIV